MMRSFFYNSFFCMTGLSQVLQLIRKMDGIALGLLCTVLYEVRNRPPVIRSQVQTRSPETITNLLRLLISIPASCSGCLRCNIQGSLALISQRRDIQERSVEMLLPRLLPNSFHKYHPGRLLTLPLPASLATYIGLGTSIPIIPTAR